MNSTIAITTFLSSMPLMVAILLICLVFSGGMNYLQYKQNVTLLVKLFEVVDNVNRATLLAQRIFDAVRNKR